MAASAGVDGRVSLSKQPVPAVFLAGALDVSAQEGDARWARRHEMREDGVGALGFTRAR